MSVYNIQTNANNQTNRSLCLCSSAVIKFEQTIHLGKIFQIHIILKVKKLKRALDLKNGTNNVKS